MEVILAALVLLLVLCVFLNYYVGKKGELHYENSWIKLHIERIPSFTEMTVKPSPQWIKGAGKEIQEKYNLDDIERIHIAGIIAKHKRMNK